VEEHVWVYLNDLVEAGIGEEPRGRRTAIR
jgi:hypothetical protein